MKEMTWSFILLFIIETCCTENDDPLRNDGSLIYEHDYPFAQDFLRYDYSGEKRLEKIYLVTETSELVWMSFKYSDTYPDKVIKVHYNNGGSPVIIYDSLVYDSNQLVEIINNSIGNDSVLSSSNTRLDYNSQGQLIKITSKWNEHSLNCITEVEFSDYVDNEFTRVDYRWCSNLQYITKLEYDKKVSPFKLMDKNIKLVLLTHFGGTAYNFITESNVTKIYIEEYNQPALLTSAYEVNYKYDFLEQPKRATRVDLNHPGTKWTNFYRYK